MLNPEIKKLIVEIVAFGGHEQEKARAEQEPEVYLVSLLATIKRYLPDYWVMLSSAVEQSRWGPLFEIRSLYPSAKTSLEIVEIQQAEREKNPPAHPWLSMPKPKKLVRRNKGKAPRKKIRRGHTKGELVNR